ncbi:MAG: hypothetical protein H6667_12530 [Ardenticatenaceae bacterium]|nr:hypothetical protein [Ardenticatenaceae bacterium]
MSTAFLTPTAAQINGSRASSRPTNSGKDKWHGPRSAHRHLAVSIIKLNHPRTENSTVFVNSPVKPTSAPHPKTCFAFAMSGDAPGIIRNPRIFRIDNTQTCCPE